ncbi:nitroreductase family protein [Shewanella frigidimarina]|jgi:nitroreductase|uniref:Nitroreductase n=1 Tax=Shewanella frigidimarina (strain NCIMB 400) TaxID=318167 RepID=Q07Y75_SHEFN|nr:nitroreductase family protein [Shewanella frigidimarina]ABI73039.1 nitroreductase [Shewanella frigidimarina NCIMB 400]MBB1382961.1 nitroreductase family protein [Shewanella sp. SR41-2]RPA33681.1 nitroreductase family protein [Shewanella frigidimarina]RPA64152.1 nitroreductase family protein [Shewanella frigidimarina]|tara:strand:+ start:2618 stop:3289 length:672 start_codon:yes stop_codon:yes gene_type:complete
MTQAHLPLTDFIEYSPDEMLKRAQDNYQQVKRRHSIRAFSDRAVPQAIIEQCILAAGTAPNGANHQPWHFVAINSPQIKAQIRQQAEALEQAFYAGRAGEEWLDALKPLGTNADKPYLEHAPWLIAVFSKKRTEESGEQKSNYYVHESVGIATGFLIQALHHAGLGTLTHTPKPMSFLSKVCGRDNDNERPYMLIIAGYPADDATIPQHAIDKKSLNEICDFI